MTDLRYFVGPGTSTERPSPEDIDRRYAAAVHELCQRGRDIDRLEDELCDAERAFDELDARYWSLLRETATKLAAIAASRLWQPAAQVVAFFAGAGAVIFLRWGGW